MKTSGNGAVIMNCRSENEDASRGRRDPSNIIVGDGSGDRPVRAELFVSEGLYLHHRGSSQRRSLNFTDYMAR